MKDPLQKKPSPYELLGVNENSDKKTIDFSFKQAIGRGHKVKDVTQARLALSKPIERSMVDLFMYNNVFLGQLEPGDIPDVSMFQAGRRKFTDKWFNLQRTNFPFHAATHSIAVNHYWSAVSAEEERIESKSFSGPSSAAESWNHVIANWGYIINCAEFWKDWRASNESIQSYFTQEQVGSVCQALETHFINLFISLGERYREAGDDASVRRMQEYEILFSTELKTGKRLLKAHLMITKLGQNFLICAGRMFLDKVNLLSLIQQQVEQLVKISPNSNELKELLSVLSPYFSIAVLLEHKRYNDALYALSQLSTEEKKREDVRRLTAEAYLEKGKQDFSVNEMDAAFDAWEKGLDWGGMENEIQDAVVSSVKAKAVQMQQRQLDQAIDLLQRACDLLKRVYKKKYEKFLAPLELERALELAIPPALSSTLSEFCNVRGVQLVNDVINMVEVQRQQCNPEIVQLIKQGVVLFERAVKLGHRNGEENLQNARQMLQMMESGVYDLSPQVADLMNQANQSAERTHNFGEAITLLDRALTLCQNDQERQIVKDRLCQFLNLRAVSIIQPIMNQVNQNKPDQKSITNNLKEFLGSKFLSSKEEERAKRLFSGFLWLVFIVFIVLGVIYFKPILSYASENPGKTIGNIVFGIFCIILPVLRMLYWIADKLSCMLTVPLYLNGPPCRLCSDNAAYNYDLPDYGTVSLCHTHSDQLSAIINPRVNIDCTSRTRLESSRNDLSRCITLDPLNDQYRRNRDAVNQLLQNV